MPNHPIVHIELPASDPKFGAQFYADAFGWKLHVDPGADYHMFEAEGGPGGGFVKPGAMGTSDDFVYKAGEPLVYIGTDDIGASLAKIESLGGKTLVGKTKIPQTGWFAIFADPTGNRMGLFQSVSPES